MLLKLILLAVAVRQIQASCMKLLYELGDTEKNFDVCIIHNAVPIKICAECTDQYEAMIDKFELLRTSNCSEFFDQDRVNVVTTSVDALKGIWTKAYCSKCDDQTVGAFNNATLYLKNCMSMHKGEECSKCMEFYLELNKYYKSLDEHNDGKVCFDLQDSMNRTRVHWSKELKCCHREPRMTLFIITLCLVTSLTFIFYGITYAVTKYQERNHDMLNDIDTNLNSNARRTAWILENSQSPAAAPEQIVCVNPLSDSADDLKTQGNRRRFQEQDEDSSDDECLTSNAKVM